MSLQFEPGRATDAQLLTRFEDGRDQAAFAEFVRRHGPMVMATARRVLASRADAEEAFQATLFTLAKASGKLRQDKPNRIANRSTIVPRSTYHSNYECMVIVLHR